MMSPKAKLILLTTACMVVLFYACSKYKDPPAAEPDPRLTNHYCNDSRAINFNWGFPGIPDNDSCIYPVDPFLGTWVFTDTIYLPNGDTSDIQVKNLVFSATEDTAMTHLAVSGWCGGSAAFYLTANKYYRADVDTLLEGSPGQYLCNNTDTLSGVVSSNTDSLKVTRLMFDFTITNASGIKYHKGTAVKQ